VSATRATEKIRQRAEEANEATRAWQERQRALRAERVGVEWRPASGDVIAGQILARDTVTDRNGHTNARLTVLVSTGTLRGTRLPAGLRVSVLCAAIVLRNWIGRVDPQPGDHLNVEYLGQHAAGTNRIHRFNIDHHKGGRST
jgi:hypothetical protein